MNRIGRVLWKTLKTFAILFGTIGSLGGIIYIYILGVIWVVKYFRWGDLGLVIIVVGTMFLGASLAIAISDEIDDG